MKKILYSIFILTVVLFAACKSNKKANPTPVVDGPDAPGSTLDKIKDSIFLYAKEDYLWYKSLPDYKTFNPRHFTAGDDMSALQKEVDALSQIAINPSTSKPYEYYNTAGEAKYSFIDDGTVSGELNGVIGDFGFAPLYNDVNDLRIKFVYPGSPADIAGIKRGYQITKINGRTALAYDGDGTGANLNFIINAYSNSNTISMDLKKPDGTTLTVTNLAVATYTVNPVLTYKKFDAGNGKIVGYIVFNSFTSLSNATPKLNEAFNYFTSTSSNDNLGPITDLVVDLRYNGGGYVSTAEYLDNLIVPSGKSGTLMYNTYYNDILTANKEVLLKNQWRKDPGSGEEYNYAQFDYSVAGNAVNFAKQGSLNISRVFFIVTGNTASASELTINNLRPNMDVQFIGKTSYGKPVGFFDIDINKYELFIPEFSTKNSAGQGDYYGGFTPGSSGYPGIEDFDDVTKDFGDPTEGLLAHAISYVKTGTFSVKGQTIQSLAAQQRVMSIEAQNQAGKQLTKHKFNGMVFDKKLKLRNR